MQRCDVNVLQTLIRTIKMNKIMERSASDLLSAKSIDLYILN